jgi:serine/threonine protein kinase
MQKPGHKVDLAKTEGEIRLTTGLGENSQIEIRAKSRGEDTTQQEFRVSTQTDMNAGRTDDFHADRMLETSTDTHTGTSTGTSTRSDTQSDTRQKTASGELSSLEKHHDPDGTMGCNTCQEDLVDAIQEHCRINVGDVIASRYEIKTYLGEGGMSAVYAAFDRVIKREVALKILHRDLLVRGKGSLLRFQREAQALGNLDHKNIVKIHHFDADENAQPYIVMDIVRGEPLARRLVKDQESFRFTDIIDIFVQVCDALSHAHARGVVHRDLKPSNIMVVGNDVKVLDFGIAKLMSEDSDQELQLTRTGEVFGSPLYMSPEQCRGLRLDFRSDIYSIGCVMYEAFTGNPPFSGNSHIDTMLKHVNDLPASVASSMCDARYVEKVDAILLRCMAKNPNARFQSMDEVKAALLELERETKGPVEKLKQKLELIRLKLGAQGKLTKKMIAAYCAAGLIFAGLGTTAVLQSNKSAYSVESKNASIERWEELSEQGQDDFNSGNYSKAAAIIGAELDMAKVLKNKQLVMSSNNQMLDLLNAQAILKPELLKDSGFKSKIEKVKNDIANQQKEEDLLNASLQKDLDSAKSLSPAEQEAIYNRAIDVGISLSDRGRNDQGIRILKQVCDLAAQAKSPVLMGKAYLSLGRAYEIDRDLKNARASFQKSLDIREKVLAKDDVDLARSLCCLAQVTPSDEMLPVAERAREIWSRAVSPNSFQVGWAETIIAQHLADSKQYKLAKQKAEAAVYKCKMALETQLSVEERIRAKLFLVRALTLRAWCNQEILASERKKGHVADGQEREAAINQDYHDALMYAEELNPRQNAREVDSLLAWLLVKDAKGLHQNYEVQMSKGGTAALDESGHPALLNEALNKLARATAILSRLSPTEFARQAQESYWEMGRISRAMLDFPFAEKMYGQAKELSDRAFGAKSSNSLDIQNELNAVIRDSGKKAK